MVHEIEAEARALIEQHGEQAIELLVDRITQAVRGGDDVELERLDKVLQQVERLLGGHRA